MNLETEKSMSRSELSTTPKRTAELEELLIDAEADDEQVQQSHPLVRRPWLLLLDMDFSVSGFIDQLPGQGFGPFRVTLLDGIKQLDVKIEHLLASWGDV